MTSKNWAQQDIEWAINYVSGHEAEAESATVLNTGHEITLLLPSGLPAYGAHFIGIFMMAPILVFMAILVLFPLRVLWPGGSFSGSAVVLILFCLLLFWGLAKILKLMLTNRDLFPRLYFVTLGKQGIVMHFSRLQLPFNRPRMSILWQDIKTLKRGKLFFLPGLLLGTPVASTLEVISHNGEKVLIPFRVGRKQRQAVTEQIENLIGCKINH